MTKPEEIRLEELALKKLGFVPKDYDLKASTIELMAEQAAAMGIRSMDLGKGEALYKRRLASHAVPLAEGTIQASGFQAALNRMRGEARLCFRQSPIFKPLRSVKRFFRRLREEKPGA